MSYKIAIYLPPMQSVSGGFAVLLHLGRHLHNAGYNICFVFQEGDVPYGTYLSPLIPEEIDIIAKDKIDLGPEYIWIVPEGWTQALVFGLKAKARCMVYMQNWSFGITAIPGDTRWDQLDVEFIYISDPVRMCLQNITGKDGPVLRPGIDQELFYPPRLANLEAPVDGRIHIAWMPRKNKSFSTIIQKATTDRLARLYPHIKINFVEIHHMDLEKVAETLRNCHIFLSTGFPEGCPLPPLEAMASGCIVVGFNGHGGWDYMRQARFITDENMPFLNEPWFELRKTPFEGNGLYVHDADVLGASLALEQACILLHNGGPKLATLRKNLSETAKAYSLEAQATAIANTFKNY